MSQDLAFGLVLSDRRMEGLVSSIADGLHQSATGGLVRDGPKVLKLVPRSAQDGLKSVPEPQATEEARASNAPGASADNTSIKTPQRPRGSGLPETKTSATGRPSPAYSATGVAPGLGPVRLKFFSNMSGLDPVWVDGRPIGDRKFPRASSVENEPLQPRTEPMFTCWKRIPGSKEVAQMKPKEAVYVIVRGDISGSSPDGNPSTSRPYWSIATNKGDALKATHGIPDAGFMRFNSYHGGALGLHQAVNASPRLELPVGITTTERHGSFVPLHGLRPVGAALHSPRWSRRIGI